MDFLQRQSYSVTVGSMNGPLLDLSSRQSGRHAGEVLCLVMAVTYANSMIFCPHCAERTPPKGNESVYIW